jgi:hypothetical protein
MALNLNKECKDKIKNKLQEHLPSIEINNKQFIDRGSTEGFIIANNVLPKHGPVREKLNSYIGELPLYDFLYGLLSKELNEEQTYDILTSRVSGPKQGAGYDDSKGNQTEWLRFEC